MYLLSATVSQLFEPQVPKIAVFTYRSPHFLFPLETPLRLSRNMLHGWKDSSMVAKPSQHDLSIFHSFRVIRCLSQCVSPKIAIFTYCSPNFCFPWRRPCDNHAICCMDGKTIQCLPNPSQHMPIYLSSIVSELYDA